MHRYSIFSKLLKEPLLHFLLIGVGLFFLFSQLNSDEEASDTQQIIINKSNLEVLSSVFMEENSIPPTDKEIQELLGTAIREEVLSREAIALGLDKNDRVIRHRLAQKMQYLFEDVAIVAEPSDEVLRAYFQKNKDSFSNEEGTEYNKLKQQVKRVWLEKEQQKENKIFYEDLKSQYEIILDDVVRKALNVSVIK
ncbi:MAG: hypothetical protein DRG09_07605 [Epsilonproteobacteria bacterium]|nr:MAG: hypothetical protein DRG09_07605 [Campylobacterota bacterium]